MTHVEVWFICREWTGTLDEQTKYVKQQFVEYVTKFYEDGDQNIVQVR